MNDHGVVIAPADTFLVEIFAAFPVRSDESALFQVHHSQPDDT